MISGEVWRGRLPELIYFDRSDLISSLTEALPVIQTMTRLVDCPMHADGSADLHRL